MKTPIIGGSGVSLDLDGIPVANTPHTTLDFIGANIADVDGTEASITIGIDSIESGTLAQLNTAISDGTVRNVIHDTLANQSSYPAGTADRYFFATDTKELFYDDTANWLPVTVGIGNLLSGSLTALNDVVTDATLHGAHAGGDVTGNEVLSIVAKAVAFAEMDDGIPGGLIAYNASSRPEDVGAGAADQVLVSNGAATPSWADPATVDLRKVVIASTSNDPFVAVADGDMWLETDAGGTTFLNLRMKVPGV